MANHSRRAKDLERKVTKLKSEQEQHYQRPYTTDGSKDVGTNGFKMGGMLQALPSPGSTSLQGRMDRSKGYESLHHGTIGESYALLSTDNVSRSLITSTVNDGLAIDTLLL